MFTMRKATCPQLFINEQLLPEKNTLKYLQLPLNRRFTCKKHLITKKNKSNFRYRKNELAYQIQFTA